MTIGIDASRANVPERTGTEQYSYHIIKGLVENHQNTTFVLYLADEPVPDLRHLGPNAHYRVLRWPFRLLWTQIRLSWEMLLRPPDVLFVPAHTIPSIHPRRTVTTIHDLGFEELPELYSRRRIGNPDVIGNLLTVVSRIMTLGRYGNNELDYHRWSARYAARHADHIITVSGFTKDRIIHRYHIDPRQISVVYHGFDPERYTRPLPQRIAEIKQNHQLLRPYILFTGRLEKKKNIDGLIEVLRRVRTVRPEVELVLIGTPGHGWEETQTKIIRTGLGNAVHVLGWQPHEVYVPLLAGALAFVFLSRYEGFGMPILEAFGVGTPVVASSIPALKEVGGNAAMFVAWDDIEGASRAIIELAQNPNLAAQLVDRGATRLRTFSWIRAADETFDILTRKTPEQPGAPMA